MRGRMRTIVLAALAAACAAPPAAAEERLIVGMPRDAYGSTWSIRPDGRDLRSAQAISTAPETSWWFGVTVSPNGRDRVVSGGRFVESTEVIVDGAVVAASDGAAGGAFAPDASAVVIRAADGDPLLVSLPAGGVTRLAGLAGPGAPAWSPDATTLAVATSAGLVLVPVAGGARRLVSWAAPLDGGPVALAWRADGARIARADSTGTTELDVAAGTWSPILAGAARRVAYAPDGAHLAVAQADGIHVLTAAAAPVAVIAGTDPAWSPDGRRLAYASAGRLLTAAADGRDVRVLTRRGDRIVSVDAWLADAQPPPPDRRAPSAVPDSGREARIHGWFRDGIWSTPPASASLNVVRRRGGRCSALTTAGMRRMPCARAARTWVAARLARAANGLLWAAPRRVPPGEYRLRVRAADRAGNVTGAPTRRFIQVR